MSPDVAYIVVINFIHAFEIKIDCNESDIEKKIISEAIDRFNAKELETKQQFPDYEAEKVWDIRLLIKD